MTYEQKRAVIESLLDHWQDFILPSVGVAKGDGEGLGILFGSSMASYPSVVELNRCLAVLEAKLPNHFNHLKGWYAAEWRTVDAAAKKRDAHGRMVPTVIRQRERVVPGWVTWRLVDRALDMVVALWGSTVVLELPPALNRKLRETVSESGEPAWTEAA